MTLINISHLVYVLEQLSYFSDCAIFSATHTRKAHLMLPVWLCAGQLQWQQGTASYLTFSLEITLFKVFFIDHEKEMMRLYRHHLVGVMNSYLVTVLFHSRSKCATSVGPGILPVLPLHPVVLKTFTGMRFTSSTLMTSPCVLPRPCCSSVSTPRAPWASHPTYSN